MKSNNSFFIMLLTIRCLTLVCVSQDFDFFYLVQQWPGSFCNIQRNCCYPTTGKPAADFGIHGLWPNYNNGSHPSNCDPDNPYDESKISDLIILMQNNWPTLACPSGNGTKFWAHEWNKHGTCSESVLSQHQYFKAALDGKKAVDLLQTLEKADIKPNGTSYSLNQIRKAIEDAVGFPPGIQCTVAPSGNRQLYQVYVCVDTSGKKFIRCPLMPKEKCGPSIEFPSF
ncbi:hypothetical protein PVL29_001147 [Vitis rotundifolia]|uniref:Uncharacterized protein n=1 Tax=Vitis rotundifolia TaxID=103349 RepID=A0AA39E4T2_VITRO|nr:hypothetical protein PVL29_001147 [Vitis rotundifolia]